jgi:hypothetical protein
MEICEVSQYGCVMPDSNARGLEPKINTTENNTRNHGNETKYGHHSPECAAHSTHMSDHSNMSCTLSCQVSNALTLILLS